MTTLIDEYQLLDALNEIVKGREDYVYQKPQGTNFCMYTEADGSPSCIVGHVLSDLAPDILDSAHAIEYDGDMPMSSCYVDDLPNISKAFDVEAKRLLQVIQIYQDITFSWGDSLLKTKEDLGLSDKTKD